MVAERDEQLQLRDGTRLISRIWCPEGSGPWPALLMRQPYGRSIASTVTLAHPSWWASHGYLVIVQDVRVRATRTETSRDSAEAQDTAETLDWVRSLPDCNGRLGGYGFSYQGVTQLLAPRNSPPTAWHRPWRGWMNGCTGAAKGGALVAPRIGLGPAAGRPTGTPRWAAGGMAGDPPGPDQWRLSARWARAPPAP